MSEVTALAQRIDALLPQTQCTKCGYEGCRPYADAIASGEASYNQCPPGGAQGVARLAQLLGRPVIPLNPQNGIERPRPRAVIDESLCIGCTLCLQACPVDDGGCGWLFLDRSRNGSRRWCAMEDCGTRAKIRKLGARRRATGVPAEHR